MAIELIADGGVEAVTLRSLAQRIRATPSGVLRWFDSSAHMWGRIVAAFGRRWEHWLADRARPDPRREPFEDVRVNAMLPFTDEEARWTRVWLALVEAGRSRPDLAPRIAPVEARERVVLARMLTRAMGGPPDPALVDTTLALVRGLRHAVCAPHEPMSLAHAHELLDGYEARHSFNVE